MQCAQEFDRGEQGVRLCLYESNNDHILQSLSGAGSNPCEWSYVEQNASHDGAQGERTAGQLRLEMRALETQ